MGAYYKPRNKKEIITWLIRRFKYTKESEFKEMPISKLWAIYFNCIRRHENQSVSGNTLKST